MQKSRKWTARTISTKPTFLCLSGLMNKNKPVYFGNSIFSRKTRYLLPVIICQMQVFIQKGLALPIQWLVFVLSIVHLALAPFFLKLLVGFRAFKLLKDGCLNSPHFNMILLGLKNKTNRKDPDSAYENLFTTELLFHEEIMEKQLFSYSAKQTKLALNLLKYWHFSQPMFQTACCLPIMKWF